MAYHVRSAEGFLIGGLDDFNASKVINGGQGFFRDFEDKNGKRRVYELNHDCAIGSPRLEIFLFSGTILIPEKD